MGWNEKWGGILRQMVDWKEEKIGAQELSSCGPLASTKCLLKWFTSLDLTAITKPSYFKTVGTFLFSIGLTEFQFEDQDHWLPVAARNSLFVKALHGFQPVTLLEVTECLLWMNSDRSGLNHAKTIVYTDLLERGVFVQTALNEFLKYAQASWTYGIIPVLCQCTGQVVLHIEVKKKKEKLWKWSKEVSLRSALTNARSITMITKALVERTGCTGIPLWPVSEDIR